MPMAAATRSILSESTFLRMTCSTCETNSPSPGGRTSYPELAGPTAFRSAI